MVILPAAGIGLLVVFGVGFVITYVVMGFLLPPLWAKYTKKPAKRIWNATSQSYQDDNEELEPIQIILGILGGLVTVGLFLWFLFTADELRWAIWGGLTLLGIIGGLLTFLLK